MNWPALTNCPIIGWRLRCLVTLLGPLAGVFAGRAASPVVVVISGPGTEVSVSAWASLVIE